MTKSGDKSNNEVAALAVVSPLVLQPLSVSLHTTNLLAVVIGNGVGNRVGRWVNTEATNAIEKLFLFLEVEHNTLANSPNTRPIPSPRVHNYSPSQRKAYISCIPIPRDRFQPSAQATIQ